MKNPTLSLLLVILPLLASSLIVESRDKPFLYVHDESDLLNNGVFLSEERAQATSIFDINTTVAMWNSSNFMGMLYTTQQFDSVFPTMSTINPPQNVSFQLFSHINPFTILNFTNFHLAINVNLQVTVLLQKTETTSTPFTNFNLSGYVNLQLVPLSDALKYTLFVSDYQVNDIVVPDSETANVNKEAVLEAINSIGQIYIELLNKSLAKKKFLTAEGEMESDTDGSIWDDVFISNVPW